MNELADFAAGKQRSDAVKSFDIRENFRGPVVAAKVLLAAVRGVADITGKNAKAGLKNIRKQNMRQSKRKMETKQSAAAAAIVAVTEERTTHAVIAASASPFVF